MPEFERQTDIGPPHYEQFLPPVIKDNYGKWDYHEIIKPGVMVHVAESGDKIFTVRCAQKAASPETRETARMIRHAPLAQRLALILQLLSPKPGPDSIWAGHQFAGTTVPDSSATAHPSPDMP